MSESVLSQHVGASVCLLTLTEPVLAHVYVLIEVTPHGVACADHRRRRFVSYDDLATRRYKFVGSAAAKAVMREARHRARNPGA